MLSVDRLESTDWFSILSSGDGPESLAQAEDAAPELVGAINKIGIVAGSRKALFIGAYLKANLRFSRSDVSMHQYISRWEEDIHKNTYQMSGLSPVLKVGVSPEMLKQTNQVNLASDVSTKIDGHQVHKSLTSPIAEITQELVATLGKDRTVGVKSQVAGLVGSDDRLLGVSINPSMTFTTSKIEPEDVVKYVASLKEDSLRRSPAGILWPHPMIEPHITAIDGIDRRDPLFVEKYIDLLQHLLGVPTALGKLVGYLDRDVGEEMGDSANLFGHLDLKESGLLKDHEKLEGNWRELVKDNKGSWVVLRNATPDDYPSMSQIAITNFREAPNYAYLQTLEGKSTQEKYITANNLEGIEDLCSKPNNVCNLVLEENGKILGFRVVRKNDDIADGRRLHTALEETGRGLGRILLNKSEKMAKQAGCKIMEVHATGSSYPWFERNGFESYGIRPNTISDYYLMIKEL